MKSKIISISGTSGAGKTFKDWPEMNGNIIPYIGGEEEKSEKEPLKVWGEFAGDHIELAENPVISAQCYRVAVQEGHTAAVSVSFENKPSKEEMIEIGCFFNSLDSRISLELQKLENLKEYKESLMQLLLTGIARVN